MNADNGSSHKELWKVLFFSFGVVLLADIQVVAGSALYRSKCYSIFLVALGSLN